VLLVGALVMRRLAVAGGLFAVLAGSCRRRCRGVGVGGGGSSSSSNSSSSVRSGALRCGALCWRVGAGAGLLVETARWVGGHQHNTGRGRPGSQASGPGQGAVRDVFKGTAPLQPSSRRRRALTLHLLAVAHGRTASVPSPSLGSVQRGSPSGSTLCAWEPPARTTPLAAVLLIWPPCPCELAPRTLSEQRWIGD
jgi:hypothetical protein